MTTSQHEIYKKKDLEQKLKKLKKENRPYNKPCLSVSCEQSLADDFKIKCAGIGSTASREIRKFMIEFLKRGDNEKD